MPERMEEGQRPPVFVRWSLRKSESCDHMIVDAFSVANWPSDPGEDPTSESSESSEDWPSE
jgi:hypothetical protein